MGMFGRTLAGYINKLVPTGAFVEYPLGKLTSSGFL
jgi:hypothetical protein